MVDGADPAQMGSFTIAALELPDLCGDGAVTGTEACDDGNAAAGDGCSDVCTVEAATAEVSTNNDAAHATPASLTGMTGTIEVDDDDWFRFTVLRAGVYRFEGGIPTVAFATCWATRRTWTCTWKDPSGVDVAYDWDSGPARCPLLDVSLNAQDYLLKLVHYDAGTNVDANYTIRILPL